MLLVINEVVSMRNGEKRLWEYFLNENGEIDYCVLCNQCEHGCKQSFRISGILCGKFLAVKKSCKK